MDITQCGRQTWLFEQPPFIISGAAVTGPKEGAGPLQQDIDHIFPQLSWEGQSFEQCEQQMQEKAARLALSKAQLEATDVDLFFSGDLLNQITPSGFTARALGAPFLGLFSACATLCEGLSLAALSVASGAARRALALAGSHTCTAERQFRYPNEYGGQKPPYAQHTVTAAGAALVGRDAPDSPGQPVRITAVTVGRVRDENITDPFQMGAAMAPAFADTVTAHLRERQVGADYYDLILSGDLGRDGCAIAGQLLTLNGVDVAATRFQDCGLILTAGEQQVFAGGSGCGCAAAVGCGHLLRLLREGQVRRVLLAATGALLSPLSAQQKESIPAICHAVALEGGAS